MPKGKIMDVEDHGSVWLILYRPEERGLDRVVFDWRQFAYFYEGTSGNSFYHDYGFGAGRGKIQDYFRGKTLVVEGDEWDQRVGIEE